MIFTRKCAVRCFSSYSHPLTIYYSPSFTVHLPSDHRFPMSRYEIVHQHIIKSEISKHVNIIDPPKVTREQLLTTHSADYVDAFINLALTETQQKQIGFPLNSIKFVDRTLLITGGTVRASEDVLISGMGSAATGAGGTHHATRSHGSGFCIFNDIAVAANHMLLRYPDRVQRILVIDVDTHQGDGTASIFKDNPAVFTYSIHGENNFPFVKEISDLDVELPDKCDDERYLNELKRTLPLAFATQTPDLIYFQAGTDPLKEDRLGRLNLTRDGLRQRNEYVFDLCRLNGLIPVVTTMGGGYSRPIELSAQCHLDVFRAALKYRQLFTAK